MKSKRPSWLTCTCERLVEHGMFERCPDCGFQFRDTERKSETPKGAPIYKENYSIDPGSGV